MPSSMVLFTVMVMIACITAVTSAAIVPATSIINGATAAAAAGPAIVYQVMYDEKEGITSGRVGITVYFSPDSPDLPPLTRSSYEWVHPRAVPSAYDQHPYDSYVTSVTAKSRSGHYLSVTRGLGPRWIITGAKDGDPFAILTYDVLINDMERATFTSVDSSRLRAGYAMLLGYTIFGYLDLPMTQSIPLSLLVISTTGSPVQCTLWPSSEPSSSCGAVAADHYELCDSQIIIGSNYKWQSLPNVLNGYISIYSEQTGVNALDIPGVIAGANTAYANVNAWFNNGTNGSVIALNSYVMVVELVAPLSTKHVYGFSVEHLNSASINIAWDAGLTPHTDDVYRNWFIYNLAHHISHAWLPKRCYGLHYRPHTFELLPMMDNIWFNEGWPQYIAMEAMAIVLSPAQAQKYRSQIMSRFTSIPPSSPNIINGMTLPYLSLIASSSYATDFRTGQSVFARGALMAYNCDRYIIKMTSGSRSLRDGIASLLATCDAKPGPFDMNSLANIIANGTSGVDCTTIINQWLAPYTPSLLE